MKRPLSPFECVTLPLKSFSGVRCGQTEFVADSPVGCSGNAYQKPKRSDPAATLFLMTLSGLVIQNVAGRSSVGSRPSSVALVPSPRFPSMMLSCSMPSSKK
jgi:hypothetical protein